MNNTEFEMLTKEDLLDLLEDAEREIGAAFRQGRKEGYDEGYEDGKEEGYEAGVNDA